MSWKLLYYPLLSVLLTAKFDSFAPEILCVTKHHGSRACQKTLRNPEIIWSSLKKKKTKQTISNQFWCHEGFTQFMLCTHYFTQIPSFQKAPFTEIWGWECRDWCWVLLGPEGGWRQFSPWVSLAGNDGQALALSSLWHSNPGAEMPASLISPCSLCPSSSGCRRWDCSAQQLPVFSCQVEMGPMTFVQAGFTLATSL